MRWWKKYHKFANTSRTRGLTRNEFKSKLWRRCDAGSVISLLWRSRSVREASGPVATGRAKQNPGDGGCIIYHPYAVGMIGGFWKEMAAATH